MKDFGRSDDPRVQAQLDRLAQLSLPQGRFGLETVRALLDRLGSPHQQLPPVFHVAGTNGKGSVCAFLRAMLEAGGKRVHVATSPHLVRYNERIRIAGELIDDKELADLLEEVLDTADGLAPSFFEVTVAASFLAFARHPADACGLEVGLGGRFDATNVIENPAVCGIAALGIDHAQFLLAPEANVPEAPLARIAFEKAGITKPGSSLVTMSYPDEATLEIERAAARNGAPLAMKGRDWQVSSDGTGLFYRDKHGELALPMPALKGAFQIENAALAVAMLRHQDNVSVERDALAIGLQEARWPARFQRLSGELAGPAPVFLDGGHNPDAARRLAQQLGTIRRSDLHGKPHLIIGMLASKDIGDYLEELVAEIGTVTAIPIPGHDAHEPPKIAATARAMGITQTATAPTMADALVQIGRWQRPGEEHPILIGGSLYLAGDALRLSGDTPD